MSAREVRQALNDMEQMVANALSTATERLGDLDRTNDGHNAVIIPAWALRALIDKIIYDQHFIALTRPTDNPDFWHVHDKGQHDE